MKIPGSTTLSRLNPLKPLEKLMNAALFALVKKFLASAGKSLLTAVLAGLTAFLGVPAPTDPGSAQLWLLIVLGIRTLISVITRALEYLAGTREVPAK